MRKNKRSITLMILIAHMLIGLPASQAALAEAKKERLVDLSAINPHIVIDLKYATADNFLKEKVYDDNKCYVLESLA